MHADQARASFVRPGGDHLTLLNIWQQWLDTGFSHQWCRENFLQYRSLCRARDVRDQLAGLLERVEVPLTGERSQDVESVQRALTAGFFYNAARISSDGQSYRNLKSGQTVYIHPSSTLLNKSCKYVLYYELVLTTKEYIRSCLEIKPEWLMSAAPHYFDKRDFQGVDAKRVRGRGIS